MLAIDGGTPVVSDGEINGWPEVTDDDRAAVLSALDRSTPWRWPLPDVQELEEAWQRHTGMKFAVAANSGTGALHMTIAAAASVQVTRCSRLPTRSSPPRPVCRRPTPFRCPWTPIPRPTASTPPGITRHITERTRAIVAVDLHGLPADYDALRAVAREGSCFTMATVDHESAALHATAPRPPDGEAERRVRAWPTSRRLINEYEPAPA